VLHTPSIPVDSITVFRTCPNWLWGSPCLLYSGYQVSFLKRPGRGINHQSLPSAEVKERVELYLYYPFGPSRHVLVWTLPLAFLMTIIFQQLICAPRYQLFPACKHFHREELLHVRKTGTHRSNVTLLQFFALCYSCLTLRKGVKILNWKPGKPMVMNQVVQNMQGVVQKKL